ncbi:MAG: prepilin peptidase [Anaerolineae bacterium]|nr:prepilin peptidase [Anaerolineae bacterium]
MTFLTVGLGVLSAWIIGSIAVHGAEAILNRRALSIPRCPYCTAPYSPWQWSALLALLTGHGRCATCHKWPRAPRIVGELFLMFAWGIAVARFGFSLRVLYTLLTMLPLLMILVTDLEAKYVPNLVMLPSIVAIVILGLILGPALPALTTWPWWQSLAGAGVGFLILRLLVTVGVAIFGEGALGEGDMTLATYIGGVVGFPMVITALVLAFLFGGVGALLVLIATRANMRTAIPYGPFLILGCIAVLLWGPEIMVWFLE